MAHRLEKIDLLEWGWHKVGDPSKPKSGILWGNIYWPQFYLTYNEIDGRVSVVHRYAKTISDDYTFLEEIYRYLNIHKDYEHEWDD